MRMLRRTPPAPVRPAARPSRNARPASGVGAVGQGLTQGLGGVGGRLSQWVYDTRSELKKVVWPTREQALNLTALVIGVSVAVAAFIGAVDAVLSRLFQLVLGGA